VLAVEVHFLQEKLQFAHAVNWLNNPFTRGAYSYVKVGGMQARKQLAGPVDNTLFFAGEATYHEGEAGTVEAALATGERAAEEVLRSVQQ
jgi:monoamine oxidase